jgi:hypothetical protein
LAPSLELGASGPIGNLVNTPTCGYIYMCVCVCVCFLQSDMREIVKFQKELLRCFWELWVLGGNCGEV